MIKMQYLAPQFIEGFFLTRMGLFNVEFNKYGGGIVVFCLFTFSFLLSSDLFWPGEEEGLSAVVGVDMAVEEGAVASSAEPGT